MTRRSRDHDAPVVVVIRSDGADAQRLADTQADVASASVVAGHEIRIAADPQVPFPAALAECRRGLESRDVVVLQAGVRLPEAWDARLAKTLAAEPTAAAVSPLCDAVPLHALLDAAQRAAHDVGAIDRAAFCLSDRAFHEAPLVHGACAMYRAAVLDELAPRLAGAPGVGDFAAAFGQAAFDAGYILGVCDFLYVGFDGTLPAPPPSIDQAAFRGHRPFERLARSVAAALAAGLTGLSRPGLDALPVVLHVTHYWGGGTDRWVRDLGRHDADAHHLILASYRIGESGGQRVVLYADARERAAVRTWDIARPIEATLRHGLEYRRILEEVVRDFSVDAIVVSSLIGHSLDALAVDRPTVYVAHDFYPACASINPWLGRICGECGGEGGCCAVPNSPALPFGEGFARAWPALRRAFVAQVQSRGLPFVVPSRSAAALWRALVPQLGEASIEVVPHGIEDPGPPLPWQAPAPGGRLRLVIPGRIAPNKGEALLREAAAQLAPLAEVTLLGCGPAGMRLAAEHGWHAIERYELHDLRALLGEFGPHAAVLASVVPETYSYTLTEMRALGIPPIATRLGAFAERIRDGEDGFLYEPQAVSLVSAVRALQAEPARLGRVAATLAAAARPRAAADMVRDYHRLLGLSPQPVARFRLAEHPPSALTEAYAELDRAYHDLAAAYEETRRAYDHARAAFDSRDRLYLGATAELERVRAELEAMRVRRWAANMVSTLRGKARRGERQS